MKKILLLFLLIVISSGLASQNITISFQPQQSNNVIDSIWITNLSTGQKVKLLGNESLTLSKATVVNDLPFETDQGFIYPNPCSGIAELSFSTSQNQEVKVSLLNIDGQLLTVQNRFLTTGLHKFQLRIPSSGIYNVIVQGRKFSKNFKTICIKSDITEGSISYIGFEERELTKGAIIEKALGYNQGDILHYSVHSINNNTIITDSPSATKSYYVEFYECKDQDNKNYKIVRIGNQIWMAENLAYLPSVNPASAISETEPFYYVYGYHGTNVNEAKLSENYSKYGVLYNWPAAMDVARLYSSFREYDRGVCPAGWHMPTDTEWKQLEMFLGMNQEQADGGISRGILQGNLMKTTIGWSTGGSKGTNACGFSGQPGGYLNRDSKNFSNSGFNGYWWSSTEKFAGSPFYRSLSFYDPMIDRFFTSYSNGYSIRCIRNFESKNPPIAEFSISKKSPEQGEIIQFTDISTNNPTSWLWIFGDGTTSTSQNPLKLYNKAGSYNINLKVTNSFGSNTKSINIPVIDGNSTCIGCETGKLIDNRDNREYKTVKIGKQWWMAENLAYLPSVIAPDRKSSTEPFYYVNGYSGTNVALAKQNPNYLIYGVLYNWPAAMAGLASSNSNPSRVKGVCPSGWHLPSDAEWTILSTILSGENIAGSKMKETGTVHWKSPNTGSTNESGFWGLPGGGIYNDDQFRNIGTYGCWWSSSEQSFINSWIRFLYFDNQDINRMSYLKDHAFSVRCIKDNESQYPPVANFTVSMTSIPKGESIQFIDLSTNMPTNWSWTFGDGSSSTSQNPLKIFSSAGTYNVMLNASNNYGNNSKSMTIQVTDEGNDCMGCLTGKFTDFRENKEYKAVKIGNQWWMAENLAYLPSVSPPSLLSENDATYYIYGYNGTDVISAKTEATYSNYGVLYNSIAAMSGTNSSSFNPSGLKGVCPDGWHLPSDDEWKQLEITLGMPQEIADFANNRGSDQGIQMKTTTGWNGSGNGTNCSGFSGLPGGYNSFGTFSNIGTNGYWWTSTHGGSSYCYRNLSNNNTNINRSYLGNTAGLSVRCVRDYESSICSTADFTVSKSCVTIGESIKFIDKSTESSNWQWTFGDGNTSNSQNPSHTYYASGIYTVSLKVTNNFGNNKETTTPITVIDSGDYMKCIDPSGRSYKTVQIGNQLWMAENLAYLPSVRPPTQGSSTEPYFYVYGYSGTSVTAAKLNPNYSTYGVLYNWPAAMFGSASSDKNPSGVKGICPQGWHLPSDAEWKTLENFLIAKGYNYDGTLSGNKIAKSVATATGWNPHSGIGSVGNTDYPVYRNKSGFSGLPSGYRDNYGKFVGSSWWSNWWSSTESSTSTAYSWDLVYSNVNVMLFDFEKDYGLSVRCVRDNKSKIPAADFTASKISATTGEFIQFNDKSTESPSNWLWTFGDGTTSASQNPSHSYTVSGTYTVSMKVTNDFGIDTKTMTINVTGTGNTGDCIDPDGRSYKTVKIGSQIWMAENLAYLPSVGSMDQASRIIPYFYVYGYAGTDVVAAKQNPNYSTYGVLYNLSAAMAGSASSFKNPSGVKGICPKGWHLPSDAEWKQLETALGMTQEQADQDDYRGTDQYIKMKSSSGWLYENGNGTNSSGFSGLPGGYRTGKSYDYLGLVGSWWSSTAINTELYWIRSLGGFGNGVNRSYYNYEYSFSVRCVKD